MKEETLSDKRIVYGNASGRGIIRYEEKDVKEAVEKLKEEDLYRSLIAKHGKPKLFSLSGFNMIDVIESYWNKKIDKLAGSKLTGGGAE